MRVPLVLKKNGTQADQALGRSRGGFTTTIHVGVDGLGNPLRVLHPANTMIARTPQRCWLA